LSGANGVAARAIFQALHRWPARVLELVRQLVTKVELVGWQAGSRTGGRPTT